MREAASTLRQPSSSKKKKRKSPRYPSQMSQMAASALNLENATICELEQATDIVKSSTRRRGAKPPSWRSCLLAARFVKVSNHAVTHAAEQRLALTGIAITSEPGPVPLPRILVPHLDYTERLVKERCNRAGREGSRAVHLPSSQSHCWSSLMRISSPVSRLSLSRLACAAACSPTRYGSSSGRCTELLLYSSVRSRVPARGLSTTPLPFFLAAFCLSFSARARRSITLLYCLSAGALRVDHVGRR
jgi:hypothetical protein